MKFKKKPVIIEAIQWTGANTREVLAFCPSARILHPDILVAGGISIPTLEGEHSPYVGDWIIKGVKGELYPIKDAIFQETYEPVEE